MTTDVRVASSGPAQPAGEKSLRTRAWVEQVMGLPVSIHVRAVDPDRPEVVGAVGNVYAHLRRVDAVFSPWRADSDLMRVRRGALSWVQAHPWLSDVERLCREAERATDGLFTSTRRGPDGTVGFDPTGLVKGWGVAGAAAHLEVVDGIAFSVNAGGDIVCGVGRGLDGAKPLWRVGIEDPREPGRIAEVVPVTVGALATSGAAARGAHITDPRTGEPVDRPGSATVTGPDLTWADVWATAAFVDPAVAGALMGASHPAYVLRTH